MTEKNILGENLETILSRIGAWWSNESIGRPLLSFSLKKEGETISSSQDLNRYWPSPEQEPDIERLVERYKEDTKKQYYFGESIPRLPLMWGGRCPDSALASYLGGKVVFTETTVWTKPVITDWEKFTLHLDENNVWLKRTLEFFKLAVEKSNGEYIPLLPELGDAITILSILRGPEKLLMDLIENKEAVRKARNEIIQIWHRCHEKFWRIYSEKFPGDHCVIVWAPEKVFLAQCDISVAISQKMFIEYVVPEIEAMDKYFPCIIWHLDGSDQIKHLDVILDLPQIKTIQWVPSPRDRTTPLKWLPMYKKIQNKGKSLLLYPANEKEVKILLEALSPKGLFLQGGFTGHTVEQAFDYIDMVWKLSKNYKV